MAPLSRKSVSPDRLPPHAPEMERGVLSCILQEPAICVQCFEQFRNRSDVFYDLRNQTVLEALMSMHRAGEALAVDTLCQHLKDESLIKEAGGYDYVQKLPDASPSSHNLSYYLNQVLSKYRARILIGYCTEVTSLAFDSNGDIDRLFADSLRRFQSFADDSRQDTQTIHYLDAINFNSDKDENNIIGLRDGKTTRFLCRGHSAWLIGPSGIGKSSLLMLVAISCCLGVPFFGVQPQRPLRVLLVQAENDIGDLAEMIRGIAEGLSLNEASQTRLQESFIVKTCTGRIGQSFCEWLEREIELCHAEIVFVDPLLSFAGVEVGRQDQASRLCREWLDPILKRTGAVLISNHHTGKPEKGNGKPVKPQSIYDLMYSGIGSSELVNWSRAVLILQPSTQGDNLFKLTFAKRGKRAWALQPNGDFTLAVWLSHAEKVIFWNQVEPPELIESGKKENKLTIPQQIACLNLGTLLSKCPKEGESQRSFIKRLVSWLSSKESPKKSLATASRGSLVKAVGLMLDNEKLEINEQLYFKGPNA